MVLVGQNLRPYFKFTLPTLEILGLERDIWDQANSDSFDPNQVSFYYSLYFINAVPTTCRTAETKVFLRFWETWKFMKNERLRNRKCTKLHFRKLCLFFSFIFLIINLATILVNRAIWSWSIFRKVCYNIFILGHKL
jgi:hypothetical protein